MIRSRVWTAQPPAGTPIEWDQWIAEGLVCLYPGNSLIDAVAGINLSSSQYAVFSPTSDGIALARTVTTNSGNSAPTPPVVGTGAISAFGLFSTTESGTATNINYLVMWGNTSGGTFQMGVESGVLWARNNGDTASAGSGYNDGKVHSYGWSKPASGTEANVSIYGDGISLATTTSGTTVLDFNSTALTLGYNPGTTGTGFVGTIGLYAFWNRVLGPQDFDRLAHNPWQLFWKRRRFYSIIASTGSVFSAAPIMPDAIVAAQAALSTATSGETAIPGAEARAAATATSGAVLSGAARVPTASALVQAQLVVSANIAITVPDAMVTAAGIIGSTPNPCMMVTLPARNFTATLPARNFTVTWKC